MPTPDIADKIAQVADRSRDSLPRCMTEVANLATRLLPGCDGASVSLWDGVESSMSVTTHPDLGWLVEAEEGYGGPARCCLRDRRPVLMRDLARDRRWPGFRARALAAGVRCVLARAEPLRSASVVLSMYSVRPDAFTLHGSGDERFLVAYALAALRHAADYEATRRTEAQMRQAVEARGVVERATGVMMERERCSGDEAFAVLRRMSQHSGRRMADVARDVASPPDGGDGPSAAP